MAVYVTSERIITTSNTQIVAVSSNDYSCKVLDQQTILKEDKDNPKNQVPYYIDCTAISVCGKYFAVTSSNKQLLLFKTFDWSLSSKRDIKRAASQIVFTPSARYIVIADKSGDVYSYSVESPQDEGMLLLGHLSMLLDVLITADENYIITSDRDEKIRVSSFPNAYNIHSFCLGHDEFVSCICELPHDPSVLISTSGDGTLRLWDYLNGKQLYVINCTSDIFSNEDYLELDNEDYESDSEGRKLGYVRYLRCRRLDSESHSSIICACSSLLKGLLIYQVKGFKDNLNIEWTQTLSFHSVPRDFTFSHDGDLWVLQPVKENIMSVFKYNETASDFEPNAECIHLKKCLCVINSTLKLPENILHCNKESVLYKKSYDNVNEYYERKKLRLKDSVTL